MVVEVGSLSMGSTTVAIAVLEMRWMGRHLQRRFRSPISEFLSNHRSHNFYALFYEVQKMGFRWEILESEDESLENFYTLVYVQWLLFYFEI